jgi:hypothetical protein
MDASISFLLSSSVLMVSQIKNNVAFNVFRALVFNVSSKTPHKWTGLEIGISCVAWQASVFWEECLHLAPYFKTSYVTPLK